MIKQKTKDILKFFSRNRNKSKRHPLWRAYPDDTFIVSYPRSGNTWLRYLIAYARHPQKEWRVNNLNEVVPDIYQVGDRLKGFPRPRIIKSHEAYQSEYPRVVYLYRDGRDVLVSLYKYMILKGSCSRDFDKFFDDFMEGNLRAGSWHRHVSSWMSREKAIPFLPIKYEYLCKETEKALESILEFLHIEYDEDIIKQAVEKTRFDLLRRDYEKTLGSKDHLGTNGRPGKGKEVLNEEQQQRFQDVAGTVMGELGYNF